MRRRDSGDGGSGSGKRKRRPAGGWRLAPIAQAAVSAELSCIHACAAPGAQPQPAIILTGCRHHDSDQGWTGLACSCWASLSGFPSLDDFRSPFKPGIAAAAAVTVLADSQGGLLVAVCSFISSLGELYQVLKGNSSRAQAARAGCWWRSAHTSRRSSCCCCVPPAPTADPLRRCSR